MSLASPRTRTSLYGLAAVLAAVELFVGWQAIHPHVSDIYRSYYIDQSTTCLDQPVPGDYAFGTEVPFVSGSETLIKPLRVCGWEGPAGDGLHAVGESARLRFALPAGVGNLSLMLQLVAVDFAKGAGQPVTVVVNGKVLDTLTVHTTTPQRFTITIPDDVLAADNLLNVELKFPQAIRVDPNDSATRKRSIKLSAASVTTGQDAGYDF